MRLRTGVLDSDAVMPGPPQRWSFSSLKDAEACARRYALTRARYPDLWPGMGYPRRPSMASLFGDVVHDVLERVAGELAAAGCASASAPEAVEVLKSLGGYSLLVRDAVDRRLDGLRGNPRLDPDRINSFGLQLGDRLAAARALVQSFLARTDLPSSPRSRLKTSGGLIADDAVSSASAGGPSRRPIELGAHAELEVVSDDLRALGRIDVLSATSDDVHITDYKTGSFDPDHEDQLRLYALLWFKDRVVNPSGRLATRLTLAYGGHSVAVPAPSSNELEGIERDLRARIHVADLAVVAAPPVASPSPENCAFCQVRQLCDVYWKQQPPVRQQDEDSWLDLEAAVGQQNGSRSWWAVVRSGQEARVLLRTTDRFVPPPSGTVVRILGARRQEDLEDGTAVVALSGSSEIFVLA
jgi:RecB family exonuclease